MASFAIPNFRFGLDQRRPRVAGASGTLWNIENAHLTRGGDIERAKAFVPIFTLPAGAFGLAAVGSRLFTFGSAGLSASMPPGVNYLQCAAENGANMTRVLTSVSFIGSPYVIAAFDDGGIRHFSNGVRITDWDTVSDANASISSLTDYLAGLVSGSSAVSATAYASTILITSNVAGVADVVTAGAVNGGTVNDQTASVAVVQAAVPAVAGVAATATLTVTGGSSSPGVNTFTSLSVNGVSTLYVPVDWVGSNAATANAIAAQINNATSTPDYVASAVGAVVTISAAPNTGVGPNGFVVVVNTRGNATAATAPMSGGVAAVTAVAQVVAVTLGGTFETLDQFTVTVNGVVSVATGRASGAGTSAFIFLNRVYSCANTHLKYCAINAPTDWTTIAASSGAGFINMASQTNGAERLTGIDVYSGYAAIFSSRSARLYTLTADATQVSIFQQMKNTGAISGTSLQSFANTDLFYLGVSGIRSLKAKDTTNAAYANDAGAAVDTHVQNWMASVGPGVSKSAISVIEPLDQRYWLAIGARIYIYSYFPSTQIGAWSYYSPGFAVSAFAVIDTRLYCQSGNTVYLYGGYSGQVYPAAGATPVTFETPFLAANTPEKAKLWTSFDVAAQGVWAVSYLVDPNDYTKVINGGTIVNSTYSGPSDNLAGRSPLFALKMVCASAGYATFSGYSATYLERNV